jgi:predicted ATPase
MLILAYLVLQHQTPPPDLIAIEEPDRGLHPYLLGQVITFLRAMSQGRVGGRPVQILLATHSPQLLEHAAPEEIRFVSRRDGDVVVDEAPTTTPEWQEAFEEHQRSLAGIWLAGGMGGVPGAH